MALSKIKRSDLTFGDPLGKKGHIVTYRATWTISSKNCKEVAVKKLSKQHVSEKDILAKLDHRNIVKLLGVTDEDTDVYLVLDLCPGGSLREYLDECKEEKRRLPAKQFFDWAKQAGRPIEYLKSIGVVHKDIKSQSYVIAANNTLKLTDFGTAKNIEAAKMASDLEPGSSRKSDPLTEFTLSQFSDDVFAYGVVIWELWTTDTPFNEGEGKAVIWKAYYKKTPIPIDCPKSVADVMRLCLESDRKQRPSIEHVLAVVSKHCFIQIHI